MVVKQKKITSYMKNVARSFNYAIGDIFTESNPVIKSLIKETKSVSEDIYSTIKDFKYEASNSDNPFSTDKAKEVVSNAWENMKEDLSTGNWYNKQRGDGSEEMMKALGFDMGDFNLDFGDSEDWGDYSDDFDDDSTKATIESDTKNTAAIIGALDDVGAGIANSVSNATVESASYIVSSSNRASKALYDLNTQGFMSINRSIGNLNETVGAFAKIGEPLTAHMQNAALFYTNTTRTLNDMNQALMTIVKNTTPPPLAEGNRNSTGSKGRLTDILGFDGISIESYRDMIKENFKDSKDLLDMGLGLLKGFSNSGGKNISVMQWGTKMIANVIIPKMFQDSMKSFNDTLKYALSGGLQKIKNSDNLIVSLLGDLFLPKDGYKDKIRNSKYNKGQVAWDGKSRKALIEVIPSLLSNILSALTGDEAKIYDYEEGEFRTKGNIAAEFERGKQRRAQSAGGEFRDTILEDLKEEFKNDEEKRKKLEKEIEQYFYKAFTTGRGYTDVMLNNFNYTSYGLSEESWNRIRNRIRKNRTEGGKHRNDHLKFVQDLQLERDSYGDENRRIEENGDSIYGILNNGLYGTRSGTRTGNLFTDEFGRSQLSYLREIALYSKIIAEGSGVGGRRRRGRGFTYDPRTGTISTSSSSTRTGGERTRAEANTSNNNTSTNYTDNDMQDILDAENQERAEEEERNATKNEAKGKIKTWVGKVKEFFNKENPNGLNAIYNRPFNAVANLLNRLSLSMDKLIFGDEIHEGGLLGILKDKINDTFKDISDKLKLKERFDNIINNLFGEKDEFGDRQGGMFANARDQFKKTMHNATSSIGNTVKSFFSKGGMKRKPETAAYGRKVTKSGVVAVSEGELIIPSESNPYYHGATNKASQLRNEQNLASKFYGLFNEGGTVGEDEDDSLYGKTKKKKSKKATIKEARKKLAEALGFINEGEKEEDTRSSSDRKEELKKKFKTAEGKGHEFIRKGFEFISDGASDLFSKLFGSGKDAEKDKGIIKNILKKTAKESKENIGGVGAGALLGAGVSILTGAVVGPLMGAAIGGAVGLVANSKTMQHIIFGADPETGEVNGGLLNKQVSQFILKSAPSIAKGGVIGGAIGLLTGSPVIGALVGGTVGYVKSSEKAKEYLFGKVGEDGTRQGGLISKKLMDKIKASMPNVAAGAIGGALLGPFGLVGNILLGGALGFASTNKKFHDFMFGDGKENKGLVGKIQDKILGNINVIFRNMGNALIGTGKKLLLKSGIFAKETLSGLLEKLGNKLASDDGPLGKLYNLGGKLIGGLTNKLTDALGGILGNVAVGTSKYNLKHGFNVYDKTLKRNLTAEERVRVRGKNDNGRWANFDRTLMDGNLDNVISDLETAKTDKTQRAEILKKYGLKGTGSIATALDLAKQENALKNTSPEAMAKKEETFRDRLLKIIANIDKNLAGANGGSESSESSGLLNAAQEKLKPKMKKVKWFEGEDSNGEYIIYRIDGLSESKYRLEYKDGSTKGKFISKEEADLLATYDGKYENFGSKVKGKIKGLASKIKGLFGKGKQENATSENNGVRGTIKEEAQYVPDMFGNMHKYSTNNQGEMTEVENDSETDSARQAIEGFRTSIGKIGPISAGLGALGGLFGSIKDKLFGGGEEKEGFLSKIFSAFTGENSPISAILRLFTGGSGPISSIIKTTISNPVGVMKGLFGAIIGPALLAAGFSGKFDELGENLSSKIAALRGNDTAPTLKNNKSATVTDENGVKYQVAFDENGKPIQNENGEYQTTNGSFISGKFKVNQANTSVRSQLIKNTINGTILGRGTLTGHVVKKSIEKIKTTFGKKAAENVAENVAENAVESGVKEAAKNAAEKPALISSILSTVSTALEKIPSILKKIPFLPASVAENADVIIKKILEAAKGALKSAGSKLAGFASKLSSFLPYLKIAVIVGKGVNAWGNAESILGITQKATVGQRVIAVLIAVINSLVPIIGELIPNKVLVNIFMEIAPKLGLDVSALKEQRDAAKAEVDKYNEENGTQLSIEEYNQMNGRAGIFTKAGNAIKSFFGGKKKQPKKNTDKEDKKTTNTMTTAIEVQKYNEEHGTNLTIKEYDKLKKNGKISTTTEEEVQKYNEEHGTNLTIEEYDKLKSGKGGGIKSLLNKAKDRLVKNAVNGVLMGKGSVAGLMIGITKKNFKRAGKIVSKIFGKGTEEATENPELISGIMTSVSTILEKIPSILKKIPFLPASVADNADIIITTLLKHIEDALKGAGKKLTSLAGKLSVVAPQIRIMTASAKGVNAWGNAESILGITQKASLGQRVIAVLIAILNALIPIIGDLIPNKVLVNMFIDIGPKIGLDVTTLKEQRESAEAEVKKYNEENGTNLTVEEYNKMNGKSGIFTKAFDGVKSLFGGKKKNSKNSTAEAIKNNGAKIDDAISKANSNVVTQDEVQKYNKEHGTQLSIEEYAALKKSGKIAQEENNSTNMKESTDSNNANGESTNGKKPGIIDTIKKQLVKNTVNGVLMGKGSVAGLLLSTSKKVLTNGTENSALVSAILASVSTLLEKIPTILKRVPFIPDSVVDGAYTLVTTLYKHIETALGSAGAKLPALSRKLSVLAPQILMATAVAKGVNAWGNAESILGITEKASIGQRSIAVLIAIVNSLIPIIGDLIPNKILVNIFMDIGPKLGLDVTSLKQQRDAADAEVKKYNEENGTELTLEEYNKMNAKVGIFTKAGDFIKSSFANMKKGVKKVASGIKQGLQNAWSWFTGGSSGISENEFVDTNNNFVSQFDSKYKNEKLGNSTVAERGCGPAVATMIGNNLGAGIKFDNAINYAKKYQDEGGTKVSYFKDFLGANGITTKELPGKNMSKEVIDSLMNGKEVILLGNDKNNVSKEKSPFGPGNHYIIASGIDSKGNIIVKDPESTGPKAYPINFLKNAKYGMYTNGSGGASGYDTDIARKVWAYFTDLGYSPAATAGLMGNLYAESGMNPARFQDGGPAAGIAQWESYAAKSGRWAKLNEFAKQKGYQWSDLDAQLQFIQNELSNGSLNPYFEQDIKYGGSIAGSTHKNAGSVVTTYDNWKKSTDVDMATRQFEAAFERAGIPHIENRVKAASEYYKLYHDSNYQYIPAPPSETPATPTSASADSKGKSGSINRTSATEGMTFGGIISTITSAFSDAFGKVLLGDNKTKTASADTSNASNNSTSTLAATSVPTVASAAAVSNTANANDKQKQLADKLLGIQGTLDYAMDGARNPDNGSADCSSTVNWAYKKVTGVDIGNDTESILNSNATRVVDFANINRTNGGTDSKGPDVNKLMPGDLLLYSRPESNYTNGRPYRVGHVEMYAGNGERIGHGGGKGPKVSSLSTDSNRYIMAKRLSGIDNVTTEQSAAGSGLVNYNYGQLAELSGGSSGLLMKSRPGMKVYSGSLNKLSIPKAYSGGDSGIISALTSTLNNVASTAKESASKGTISTSLVEQLINSIIKILQSISENTANVDKIYQLLSEYTNIRIKESATTAAAATKLANKSFESKAEADIDANIASLVGTLAAIAKG